MTFKEDLKKAEPYETELMQFSTYLEGVKDITDVRDIKKFQENDIDFIIQYEDDTISNVEAKIDFFTTDNFFFEVISNTNYNTQGCILKTNSNLLFYAFPNLNKLYIIDTKKLKDWVYNYKGKFKKGGDNAEGILIKRTDIYKEVGYRVKKIYFKR
jgi:hypothetical protein